MAKILTAKIRVSIASICCIWTEQSLLLLLIECNYNYVWCVIFGIVIDHKCHMVSEANQIASTMAAVTLTPLAMFCSRRLRSGSSGNVASNSTSSASLPRQYKRVLTFHSSNVTDNPEAKRY